MLIARNEADLLPECLKSVDWADEIILLDSGSNDATQDVARHFGAKVFQNTEWRVLANSASWRKVMPPVTTF